MPAPAFVMAEGSFNERQIVPLAPIGQCHRMFEPLLLLIAAAFLLAGFIKGVIGLGLPTVAMGLLAVTMQPSRALAIVIVPAIVTQHLADLRRAVLARHHPAAVAADGGTVIGIWLNAGMSDRPLCALWRHRSRRAAGDLCGHRPQQVQLHGRPPP